MSQLGFQIHTHQHTASPALVKKFASLAVANISDVMSRTNGTTHLRPFHKGGRILGRAFTVKTAPGDNLMVHAALNLAAPGDVIVVDAGGEVRNAIIGEIMSAIAEKRGLAGIVIDGPIRIVGDPDGLLAISPAIAKELAKEVALVEKKEKTILANIAAGKLDRSWVEVTLRAKGVIK